MSSFTSFECNSNDLNFLWNDTLQRKGGKFSQQIASKMWSPYFQFQSHECEFDYLKSLEIEEKIGHIRFCKSTSNNLLILSTNGMSMNFWIDCCYGLSYAIEWLDWSIEYIFCLSQIKLWNYGKYMKRTSFKPLQRGNLLFLVAACAFLESSSLRLPRNPTSVARTNMHTHTTSILYLSVEMERRFLVLMILE